MELSLSGVGRTLRKRVVGFLVAMSLVGMGMSLDAAHAIVVDAPSASIERSLTVTTPDGLTIAVQEGGNPNGPAIIFIHGISQSHLSWTKQMHGALTRDFHLITYDLRGHGSSDKPLEPKYYQSSKAWADELKAVMQAAHVTRPVLVGWSYGGLIISDYVKVYGTDQLAGVVYVDSMLKMEPSAASGKAAPALGEMLSDDLATNIHGTRAFLHACFAKQPSPSDYETMLAFNMLTPPAIRKAMVNRPIDYDTVASGMRLPALVIHGALDDPIPLVGGRHTAATIPGARLVVFPDTGHSPFFEDASHFDTVLADFVRQIK